MKMISMNEFQNAYSTLLQEVITLHEPIVITQQEQPVVRISPYFPEPVEKRGNGRDCLFD
jgi:antitoxin (DNA-binding transcriptional repressor) of toxin-antitoxin stability system